MVSFTIHKPTFFYSTHDRFPKSFANANSLSGKEVSTTSFGLSTTLILSISFVEC